MSLFAIGTAPLPTRSIPKAAWPLLGALALGTLGYCALLWSEWSQNPDLSHGFFAPVIFGLLLWESRRQGPLRWIDSPLFATVSLAVILLAGIGLLVLAGLFAASLGWSHALVLFLVATVLACFLTAGLLITSDARTPIIPFNWISVTAIFLWVLVSPMPDGSYARLTLSLQNWVTGGVMNFLQFFGVPARQHGNVIELARTTVGVEEACSGVRSLISCVYAGFFFAAWQVRRPLRRAILIAAAPLLALAMNFVRSLTLTLLANGGIEIEGAWHDGTGFAILAITAGLLALLAMWLESKDDASDAAPSRPSVHSRPPKAPAALFWTGAGLAGACGLFFYLHSRPDPAANQTPPSLTSLVPAQADGWQVNTVNDLSKFSGILQTTDLLERTYVRPDGRGGYLMLNVYVAYWPSGRTSVSRVASHTPDACWPGSGWFAQMDRTKHAESPAIDGAPVAPAEYRFFQSNAGHAQHVWFWHVFDGRVITYRDPYSLPALLKIALEYGFRRQGSQYFIRISSNRAWNELSAEPLLKEIVHNLGSVGL